MRLAVSTDGHAASAAAPSSFEARWSDLHAKASQLARMAQLSPEPLTGTLASFPERITRAPTPRRELARQGVEDIEAMLRPGLAALETLRRRGNAANAPALALWRQFYTARASVLALVGD